MGGSEVKRSGWVKGEVVGGSKVKRSGWVKGKEEWVGQR